MECRFLVLAMASFILLPFLHPATADAKNLLAEFCSQTRHPVFCMKTFASDPRAAKAKSYNDIAAIVLGTGSKKIKGYAELVRTMMKNDKSRALPVCAENYDYASGSLRGSLSELKSDAMTANYDAKVAGDGARLCRDAMTESKLSNPNMAEKNADIQIFSDLAFSITEILQRKKTSEQ